MVIHDDVIKWKHFPRYWPFVRGIHRSPVNSPHKSQWRGTLMFSLICVWINVGVNNREAGDLRRYRAHYDVSVMRWWYCNGIVDMAYQWSDWDLMLDSKPSGHTRSLLRQNDVATLFGHNNDVVIESCVLWEDVYDSVSPSGRAAHVTKLTTEFMDRHKVLLLRTNKQSLSRKQSRFECSR